MSQPKVNRKSQYYVYLDTKTIWHPLQEKNLYMFAAAIVIFNP